MRGVTFAVNGGFPGFTYVGRGRHDLGVESFRVLAEALNATIQGGCPRVTNVRLNKGLEKKVGI